jgi:hypothetical protein
MTVLPSPHSQLWRWEIQQLLNDMPVGTSTTPPVNPKNGQLWWLDGNVYMWYVDPDSSQWVQINSPAASFVTFPATQVPSSNPNTLDDYEEGTFTPIYIPSTGAFGSITYDSAANQWGYYQKVGSWVHIIGRIRTTAMTIGSASAQLRLGGLPFTMSNTVPAPLAALHIGYSATWTTSWPHGGLVVNNTNFVNLYFKGSVAADSGALAPSNMVTGAGNDMIFAATYPATA